MIAAFEGLLVVDLSDRLSGSFAARLFGDFGARVILAEPPGGHPLRHEPPFLDDRPGQERSTVHAYVNWNKSSVVITDARDLAELVREADVVITTSDPVDPEVGQALRADAVHLSVTAHGLNNPLSGVPGNNLTNCARSGWSYINGFKDEPPLQMPHDQAGYVGGVTGFISAAAALRRRNRTGTPERVDVSELEAFALTVHPWGIAAIYADVGYSNGPGGRRPRGKPAPLWDLEDGRMHFGVADFRNWQAAMDVLQLPEIGEQEDLIPDLGRHSRNLHDVVLGMARTLPSLRRWDVFHALAKLRCVIGVVQDIDDIEHNEQYAAREYLVETQIEGRKIQAAGAPAQLFPSPWRMRRPAPALGENTEDPSVPSPDTGITDKNSNTHEQISAAELAEGPLSGIRVLSFGQAWSGTYATELLALLGADVVQIGSLHRPDVWRRVANRVPAGLIDPDRVQHALNTQGLYNSVNLNKREITLDLRDQRARDILWELIPRFDILADNFRPNVLPSWGITLEKLNELRPGMIWASISGYGADGPYSRYPANGATTEPMSGLSSLHGYEGDTGMNTGGLYPDPIGGYFLVATIMAALAHRDRSGEAQRVDLSMMEAITSIVGDAVVERDATGRLPQPRGNHHPRIAPHNNYQAATGEWLALAAHDDEAWQALVAHIGDQRLADGRFATMADRKHHEDDLDALISNWLAPQDASAAERQLSAIGVAAARIVPLYELYSRPDPVFAGSGFVTRVDHPEAGKTWLPGRPWRFSAADSAPVRPAPCVGQHSREVLVDELGMSDKRYRSLVAAGVTGTLDDAPDRNIRSSDGHR